MDVYLFASDIDNTLLGDDAALMRWRLAWEKLPVERRPWLCFNTGRLLPDAINLVGTGRLPKPDFLITGVGTNIYDFRKQQILKEFSEILEEGWNKASVEKVIRHMYPNLEQQPRQFQNPYKSSWFMDGASSEQIRAMEEALESEGLETHVVYSSNRDLDILPKWANKGNALQWLLGHLHIKPGNAIVAGDSGNDTAMFLIPDIKGIVMGNSQPELYQATRHLPIYHVDAQMCCAKGVSAGLVYYGVFTAEVLVDTETQEEQALIYSLQRSDPESLAGLTADELAYVREGYGKAIEAIYKNITPLGFSACSLEENDTVGTDVNYRSVWARDGAITVIGTLPLIKKHPEIGICQQRTFEFLLEHISPNGQVPANVRIDDRIPEYSGVGGIASIDSGLWLMLAFYDFIRTTRNIGFLRKYVATLQEVMDWLSAHDSNNDALLEIPEAGDWTDLFGRSYNVLYDEILWYRANVCFGRMLELLGDQQKAGDYIRWAQVIKREIMAHFWPTTEQRVYQAAAFTEHQYELGDARYLISQVTPFDYSWRCDAYGNVLAYLYDVIDQTRATQVFRFMWGVGINEPFPIKNIYPVVMEGDKEWRTYYTVNMLNLPNHYHNGGIWPFVGGAWVQYVWKLGLKEVALRELHKLAELNSQGVLNQWEFNEWAHGKTGRPMGKAYQAWSAASYISACHMLGVMS